MYLVIDNYDSFVYNLARYVALAGRDYEVVRNDALSLTEVEKLQPEAIILSPGPGKPQDAGICVDLVKKLSPVIPILGVCLGHQAIGEAYGGRTVHSDQPVHGKSCSFTHNASGLFADIPNPMEAGRYHSLITKLPKTSPLQITAKTEDGTIMAMQHKKHPAYGVQFHPESVLTEHGLKLIENFTAIVTDWHSDKKQAA